MRALEEAMAIGRRQGFVNHSAWLSPRMSFLCAKALEAGIEVEYVQGLIRKRGLVPDASANDLETWPRPVRIHALGVFRIELNGKLLTFDGKVKKKPLELLRALIALGGREVSEAKLTDTLWPDAEGGAGYRSFITTLQRLRKLLGHKEAIAFQEGKVSLDPRYCWLDVWAFERVIEKAEEAWKAGQTERAVQLSEKAINLYRGRLLGPDQEEYQLSHVQDVLKRKFIRCLRAVGRTLEQADQWEEAGERYRKGLEAEDRSEDIYYSLMNCFYRTKRYSEAIEIYNRCSNMLQAVYGTMPSSETEALFQIIKKKTTT